MSIGPITPGFVDGLRSLADRRLQRRPLEAHAGRAAAAAGGHPLEFWLTIFTAAGIFIAGWGCLLLKAVNRLCHEVAQPEIRAAWLRNAVHGEPLRMRQRIAWWLWSRFKAGTRSDDAFDLGACIEAGTFIGVTGGFLAYLIHLVIG